MVVPLDGAILLQCEQLVLVAWMSFSVLRNTFATYGIPDELSSDGGLLECINVDCTIFSNVASNQPLDGFDA